MGTESQAIKQDPLQSLKWIRGSLIFLALLVVARFFLEVVGVSPSTTRYFSSSAAVFLIAIYLGTVAPLRGVTRTVKLILPAFILAAWMEVWVVLATLVSAVLRLQRSHFADKEDYGNWSHLGQHIWGHMEELVVFGAAALVLMSVTFLLRRWPVTIGPGAILAALVVLRYWTEAMDFAPTTAAAWSSTVAVLVCGFYLGGMGPRVGLNSAAQLFMPSIVIGWVWRFWAFLAAVLSASFPFYRTHFFDPSGGRTFVRLAQLLGASILEGFVAGLVVWGTAIWISRATRRAVAT